MARPVPEFEFLHVFRFLLTFHFDVGHRSSGAEHFARHRCQEDLHRKRPVETLLLDSKGIGATVAAVTSSGFEVWRAIRPGHKLIEEIGEALSVDVELLGRDGKPRRTVVMHLGEATYLPFGVGVELGGRRVGRLDATDSEIALEGVVFRVFKIHSIVDTVPEEG
jgi:hypothetical protein